MSESTRKKRTRTRRGSQRNHSISDRLPPDKYLVSLPWSADEETIFHSFAPTHIDGTPWPTTAMDLLSQRNGLDCRRWTTGSLDPQVLSERRRRAQQETGVGNEEAPNLLLCGDYKKAAPVRLPFSGDEEAVCKEFRDFRLAGAKCEIGDTNAVTERRGLRCRRWTPQVLRLRKREDRDDENGLGDETDENRELDEGETYEGEVSGNGGGSERGWMSGEDESRGKRSCSV